MKKPQFALLLLCIISPMLASCCFAAPTEGSLLGAWESMQRDDPQTVLFKKTGESLYQFKTDRFPFDGQLRVLNVTVDERAGVYGDGCMLGVIEVELIDLPEDFLEKYSYSYSVWQTNNILYYNAESEEWLTSAEFMTRTRAREPAFGSFFSSYFTTCLLIIVFIIILVVFFVAVNRLQKRNRNYLDESRASIKRSLEIAEKSLSMTEESNSILRDILDELKKKNQ